MMKLRALFLSVALSLAYAANANATIIGATYDFETAVTGSTQISPLGNPPGLHTDPANPGFCVGPPVACGTGAGLSGSFDFQTVGPNLDRIVFTFFGSTSTAPGTFVIRLGNFLTVDGEVITNVVYNSGNLAVGSFTNVSFNGTTATFTGSTATSYNAIGGRSVAFDVITTQVPEPATLLLLGVGVAGIAVRRRRAIARCSSHV